MQNRFAGLAGVAIICLMIVQPARAQYMGDYAAGTDNICRYFTTYQPSTGASFTPRPACADHPVPVATPRARDRQSCPRFLPIGDNPGTVTSFSARPGIASRYA